MSNGRRLLFFATKSDMMCLLESLVALIGIQVKYVKTGNHQIDSMKVYSSIEEIPDLGYLKYSSHCMENYLILDCNSTINTQELILRDGDKVLSVYQSFNLDSIGFSPSGLSTDQSCLIHGQFDTISNTEISKKWFSAVRKVIKKQFFYEHGWYIGPEARELYDKVRFVTISTNEPIEYDFK